MLLGGWTSPLGFLVGLGAFDFGVSFDLALPLTVALDFAFPFAFAFALVIFTSPSLGDRFKTGYK